jgi:hypothetical protein
MTIRNSTHKYIKSNSGTEELYDLINDPFEKKNLIESEVHQKQLIELRSRLDELLINYDTVENSNTSGNTFSVNNGISCSVSLSQNNEVSIVINNDKRIITSNGIPNHHVGQFPNSGNPHTMSEQNIKFQVPLNPIKANQFTSLYSEDGFGIGRPNYAFGVVLNGVKLDPSAAEAFTFPGTKDKNFDWVKEALSSKNRLGDDCNNAHVQPNGEYHYHGTPWGFIEQADGKSMFLVGWAADGFPIYYKWGLKNGKLTELKSSYKLRSGTRPGDGKTTPNGEYDGTYVRDFIYTKNLGDLDEANGTFGITPQFPQGIYYYIITDDFPSIPRYFVGTPDATFKIGNSNSHENNTHSHEGDTNTSSSHLSEKEERFNKLDKNKDGKIERSEVKGNFLERFDLFDKNKDGYVSEEEFLTK